MMQTSETQFNQMEFSPLDVAEALNLWLTANNLEPIDFKAFCVYSGRDYPRLHSSASYGIAKGDCIGRRSELPSLSITIETKLS